MKPVSITEESVKLCAKKLAALMLEKHQVKLQHGHALDLVAAAFGFRDWNTLAAFLKEVP